LRRCHIAASRFSGTFCIRDLYHADNLAVGRPNVYIPICDAESMVDNMATYRLRATKLKPDGSHSEPIWDAPIDADTLSDAIEKAKKYHVDYYLDNKDYAWLTDANNNTVWTHQP
jgi:hypothetical protein